MADLLLPSPHRPRRARFLDARLGRRSPPLTSVTRERRGADRAHTLSSERTQLKKAEPTYEASQPISGSLLSSLRLCLPTSRLSPHQGPVVSSSLLDSLLSRTHPHVPVTAADSVESPLSAEEAGMAHEQRIRRGAMQENKHSDPQVVAGRYRQLLHPLPRAHTISLGSTAAIAPASPEHLRTVHLQITLRTW